MGWSDFLFSQACFRGVSGFSDIVATHDFVVFVIMLLIFVNGNVEFGIENGNIYILIVTG